MKKVTLFIVIIAAVAALGSFIFFRNSSPVPQNQNLSEELARLIAAPDFTLQDYEGKTVRLSDFKGKPVIINSWAAWCPFCREELVDFATVQKEFGDQIAIIAIDRAESRDIAKRYSDELGVTENLIFLLDPADSFYQAIGGFSMPETIFVDRDGNIREHKRGPMKADEIRERTRRLLN
jgi:cytochrome c biogenesis protein CcmG/thiol:disulfide interchange protein DsbE